jgi:hypothetical protein
MDRRVLLAVPVGWMALLVFGALYVAPTVLALADAYGRPAHEWRSPGRRRIWLFVLGISFPSALFGAAQVLALVYALIVPRRVKSPEAATGAIVTRRRTAGAFAAGVIVVGPVFAAAFPSDSHDVLFTLVGTCCMLAATCFAALLYESLRSSTARRVAVVMTLVVVATLGGMVARHGAVNSCTHGSGPQGRWCRDPYGNSLWIPPAYAAAGGLLALWVTRRPRPGDARP